MLEETDKIDFGGKHPDGGLMLGITDSGMTADPAQRLDLLRRKLKTYAAYIDGPEFESGHPSAQREQVSILVVCANPPTEEMAKIRGIAVGVNHPMTVPVAYKVSALGKDAKPPRATPSPVPAMSNGGGGARLFKKSLPILLLIAAVIGYKLYQKHKASDTVRPLGTAFVAGFPGYDQDRAYFDAAFDELHDKAFENSYKMGGRRANAEFDFDRYSTLLLGLYSRKAKEDRKEDLAQRLDQHRQVLGLQLVEFQ